MFLAVIMPVIMVVPIVNIPIGDVIKLAIVLFNAPAEKVLLNAWESVSSFPIAAAFAFLAVASLIEASATPFFNNTVLSSSSLYSPEIFAMASSSTIWGFCTASSCNPNETNSLFTAALAISSLIFSCIAALYPSMSAKASLSWSEPRAPKTDAILSKEVSFSRDLNAPLIVDLKSLACFTTVAILMAAPARGTDNTGKLPRTSLVALATFRIPVIRSRVNFAPSFTESEYTNCWNAATNCFVLPSRESR